MTQERLMDITIMELGELRAELESVNEKIDANPVSDDGVPAMSSFFRALLDEQDALEARIDMIESGLALPARERTI